MGLTLKEREQRRLAKLADDAAAGFTRRLAHEKITKRDYRSHYAVTLDETQCKRIETVRSVEGWYQHELADALHIPRRGFRKLRAEKSALHASMLDCLSTC